MASHHWLGSLCLFQGRVALPRGIVSVADAITILEDLSNRIPDKSWMLYLLEVFDRKSGVPVELDLICQFNERDNFWAIFGGVNRYKFTSVLPAVGHTFQRQIIFRKESSAIEFLLTDRTAQQSEKFVFNVNGIDFEGKTNFTGIEWWNKSGAHPFPIRYRVRVSELMCGIADGEGITYTPYDGLVPDKDNLGDNYPVSFGDPALEQGYLSYDAAGGMARIGPKFSRGQHATL
jgi:hypothetical protein